MQMLEPSPFIVPILCCMGRLEHLKQTVPLILQEFGRVVLVDWSCPEASGTWAKDQFGSAVDVVFVRGERYFSRARALNRGSARAIECGADWLLFLDADTLVTPGFFAACRENARRGCFALADRSDSRRLSGLMGILLVARADFERVGRYDEGFDTYGFEDIEMRCRLRVRGKLSVINLPAGLVRAIPHDDALRMKFCAMNDVRASERMNFEKLRARVRSWTGRDIDDVPEILSLVYFVIPTDSHGTPQLERAGTAVRRKERASPVACRPRWAGSRKRR